jgi:N-formylglutamate amidohydrolase
MTIDAPHLFDTWNMDAPGVPILLSVPHSGREYPQMLRDQARLPVDRLTALEDRYSDRLIEDCAASGVPVIVARIARAMVDLNRAPDDMDIDAIIAADRIHFAPPGRKARAGLGIVPTRIGRHGMIWKTPLTLAEVAARIATYHRPFHDRIAAGLSIIYARFGQAMLIDVHSMPSLTAERGAPPIDMVVGDGFGRTAPNWVADRIRAVAADHGLRVAINQPYAGGQIIRAHARPQQGIFGVQLEIDRALYLDVRGACDPAGTARINAALAEITRALIAEMGVRDPGLHGGLHWPQAAE